MKLSMSMLAWYLREFKPVCHIEDDTLCISGMRFVMDDVSQLKSEYLYICDAELFFSSPQYKGAFLVTNRHSTMLFLNSDYNFLLNKILSAFDYFNELESKLLNAASIHAPLQTFVEIMEPVLQNPFLIGNLDGSFYIQTNTTGHDVDPLWNKILSPSSGIHPAVYAPYFDHLGNRIRELSEKPQLVQNIYKGGYPVLMMYLCKNGESVGSISILQEDSKLTLQNIQLAPLFAKYCILSEEFVSDAGLIQSVSTVFQNLLCEKNVGSLNLQRLENSISAPPWRLLEFQVVDRIDTLSRKMLRATLRVNPNFHIPVEANGSCFALISDQVFSSCRNSNNQLLDLNGISIGASMPFSSLQNLKTAMQQTQFSLHQANRQVGLFVCEMYACNYLLQSLRSMELTATLLHPAIEALNRYDAENQTELRRTLSEYLKQERNQLFTARALHIHPNTMRYRLQRITEIAGINLENADELKYLRLSNWLA